MIWDPPPGVAFLCSFLGLQLSFYQITGQMNPGVVIPYDPSNSIGFCITSFCITRCLIPNVQDQESKQFLSQVFITKSLHTIYCAKYRNQQEKEMLKSDILFFFLSFPCYYYSNVQSDPKAIQHSMSQALLCLRTAE